MFQPCLVPPFSDDSRNKALIPLPHGPVYGGILDSPLVVHSAFTSAPITPPRSATIPPLGLPLDTSPSSIPDSHCTHSNGLPSPLTPPWPATPPSIDDHPMCIPDPDEPIIVIDPPQESFNDFALSQHEHKVPPLHDSPDRMDIDMDVDPEVLPSEDEEYLEDFDEPYDYTKSPFYSPPPELDEDDGVSPTSPLSPSLQFDDWDLAPCSPTLRWKTSLPLFQEDWKPYSSNLFSLPGAAVDEDLIPSDLCLPKTIQEEVCELPPSSSTPSSHPLGGAPSLLMINSTANIPTPSTPPQDQLDIDISRLDEHPDLRRLAILRKKSQEMESGLKVVEEQMLQQGEVQARADIRRERKWYKERSREITAMLKLVVGDDIFSRPAGSSLPAVPMGKKTIATMDHLVARMVFKRRERNDLPRPIANASRGHLEKTRHASRLCQTLAPSDLERCD